MRAKITRYTAGSCFSLMFIGISFLKAAHCGDLSTTITQIKPSIVGIGTFQKTRSPAALLQGTGFVVADGLHILTNAHVIPDAIDYSKYETLSVFVRQKEKIEYRGAKQIAVDKQHDVAILKIAGQALPPIALGDSTKVREGELFAFTGFPIGFVLGLHPVTHRGIVSAISPIVIPAHSSRQLNADMVRRLNAAYNVFQLDATAYPGNSGSPLYDPDTGRVVGLVNKVFVQQSKENLLTQPSGISYAIPIQYAKTLLKVNNISGSK